MSGTSGQWDRRAKIFLPIACALYLAGFLAYYPAVPTVRDEVNYLEPAAAMATGTLCFETQNAFTGEARCAKRSSYLPGTAYMMTPFAAAFGWRGGFLLSGLMIILTVVVTARWIADRGNPPLAALLVLGFPPALVFGRLAMSDATSAGLAALGLWLFFNPAAGRSRSRWAMSGFIAGFSTLVRETNVLLFAPFYLGALLRREQGVPALVIGGLAGTALRPLGCWFFFGDPWYVFPRGVHFGVENVLVNLPFFALYLLVFVPAGLVAALTYRGERRPEFLVTIVGFISVFLFLDYNAAQSGLAKQLVLGPRYLLPVIPLLAFACAEAYPRWAAALRARFSGGASMRVDKALHWATGVWAVGLCAAAFAVHPAHSAWSATQLSVKDGIYGNTTPGSVVITNSHATKKFINYLFGGRLFVNGRDLESSALRTLLERHGVIFLALLDRSGSAHWEEQTRLNAEFVEQVASVADTQLIYDEPAAQGERLRVWRVEPRAALPQL